jgi:pantoate--beta-alanine ligase
VPALIDTIAALRERLELDEPASSKRSAPSARRLRASRFGAPGSVALVPTMGALHDGHAELIRAARRECDTVIVSIFVNPLQFDKPDDLARYPRTLDADLALCSELGVDIVFAPSSSEVFPEPPECTVDVGRLGDHLCGRYRPGHFRGVATIVLKLFEMVQPDRAYFGEKDAQQLAIIKRLVTDLNVPVSIVEIPTVREPDGLALSSRNRHLSAEQRASAIYLYEVLRAGERLIVSGRREASEVRASAAAAVPKPEGVTLQYLDIVDPRTMQPVTTIAGPVRIAGAIIVGNTRLIDNVLCQTS